LKMSDLTNLHFRVRDGAPKKQLTLLRLGYTI